MDIQARAPLNPQLFATSDPVAVRAVELSRADPPQTHREKLARILLDEMFQFVGLLDAQGTLIDVNRNALEGAGIELDRTLGLPFWEARRIAKTKPAAPSASSVGAVIQRIRV